MYVYLRTACASGPFRARGRPEQVADRVHVAARTSILRGRSGKLRVTCAAGSQWNGSARAAGGIDHRRPSLPRRGPSTIERSAGRRPAARRYGGCAVAVTDDDTCSELAICNRDRCVCASMMEGWMDGWQDEDRSSLDALTLRMTTSRQQLAAA
jgi:hypothetical protein